MGTWHQVALDGSVSQKGGVLKATSKITCDNIKVGQTGDIVEYPDGSTAIVSAGCGHAFYNRETGKSLALIGSPLSNGDKIRSGPPSGLRFLDEYEGKPIPGFLDPDWSPDLVKEI
ncbi:hypothetical protein [Chromobacterium sp. Beijing]|uniref:hypothetical protein n=1 Tax=Chromobacterium sp. Beijing TaxID=2735795 RepID=UPI001F4477DA|nr:hypothetical protein [Chromobacterium sp. Beijing]UJB32915.1 hypothetical protein HQN78_18795 [Chromobacterium sp. Beijing]